MYSHLFLDYAIITVEVLDVKRDYGTAILLFALMFTAAVLSGCGGGGGGVGAAPLNLITTKEEAQKPGAWTILVYLDADNDLEQAGLHNFNQMELVGSTKDVRVIVQLDRSTGRDETNGNWTDTRRYLVTYDPDSRNMHSVRLDEQPLGELDMGSWHTLQDFVEWGVQEFPADNYCLVVWDHGSGWLIRSMDAMPHYKYIAVDDSSHNSINVTDIPDALANVNIDVIAFDACYMQQLEVAYELRNSARYMVGSAGTEPSPGYNYARWISKLSASTTPFQLSCAIVEAYAAEYPSSQRNITQSALDLSKIDAVSDAASAFAQVLQNNASPYLLFAGQEALNYTTTGNDPNHYFLDLWDYAAKCKNAINPAANDAYATLITALDDAIIAETHHSDMPGAHGLAIYMPTSDHYDARYAQLDFASNTLWDDWIRFQ